MSETAFEFHDQKTDTWKPAHSIADQAEADRMNQIIGREFYRATKEQP